MMLEIVEDDSVGRKIIVIVDMVVKQEEEDLDIKISDGMFAVCKPDIQILCRTGRLELFL